MDFRSWEVLLLIALNEGEGAINLAKKFNISKSAFSRHVLFLCGEAPTKGNSKNVKVQTLPPCFIERKNSPVDSRRQDLYVTREGEKFIQKIHKLVTGE